MAVRDRGRRRDNRRHRQRQACSKRHVNMTISLAFLAPSLVKAAVEGRLPHGIGVARLFDAPVAWSRQHQTLGLAH
jgi:site-specific DNA recombinase